MKKATSPAASASSIMPQAAAVSPASALSAMQKVTPRDSKKLDENLLKVKSQVNKLMEQARVNMQKQKGSQRPEDLQKAQALQDLVTGVNQVLTCLDKLR